MLYCSHGVLSMQCTLHQRAIGNGCKMSARNPQSGWLKTRSVQKSCPADSKPLAKNTRLKCPWCSTQINEHVRTQVLTPQCPHLFNTTTCETTHILLHVLIYLQFRSSRLCNHTCPSCSCSCLSWVRRLRL